MSFAMEVQNSLTEAGFDSSLAIATQAEIDAGAACGQLCILEDTASENAQPTD